MTRLTKKNRKSWNCSCNDMKKIVFVVIEWKIAFNQPSVHLSKVQSFNSKVVVRHVC